MEENGQQQGHAATGMLLKTMHSKEAIHRKDVMASSLCMKSGGRKNYSPVREVRMWLPRIRGLDLEMGQREDFGHGNVPYPVLGAGYLSIHNCQDHQTERL